MKLNRIENVVVKSDSKSVELEAKIDTGADRTSIDKSLVKKLGIKPLNKTKEVHSASGGTKVRKLVKIKFLLKDEWRASVANIADRKHMTYKMIIGCNDLKNCLVKV